MAYPAYAASIACKSADWAVATGAGLADIIDEADLAEDFVEAFLGSAATARTGSCGVTI